VNDTDPVCQPRHLGQDVAGHEDRQPFLAGQLQQKFPDLDDSGRVQPVGRLIQKDQSWMVQQSFCQPQALGISLREHAGPPLRIGTQPQPLDDLAYGLRGSARVETPGHFQVLLHGQFGVGVRSLHKVSHPRPGFRLPRRTRCPERWRGLRWV